MRIRLILSYVLIVLVTVAGMVLLARAGAAQEVRAFMLRGSMVDISQLAASLESYYEQHGSWVGVEQALDLPGRYGRGQGGMGRMMMQNQRLRLADRSGALVYDSRGESPPGSSFSNAELASSVPLSVSGSRVGYLLAEGGMGAGPADETYLVGRINRAALIAGMIAAGLSLLLAVWLTERLLRPVRLLTRAAEKLGAGDLSQRVSTSGAGDLAVLGRAFNRMAASLQDAEHSRRAMTADIAHELRTPVAVQRAYLEALQDGIYPLTVDNLEPVLSQNLTLTRLVDDLRTLALADSGSLQLERVPVELFSLAAGVVERFQAQAEARKIRLEWQTPAEPAPASVDPIRIEQILANLLTNALRHTPDGGRIEVRGALTGRAAQIIVADSGGGIPPEALPHIFERFYRADRSRSRGEGGAGLGLAIARKLAEAHGGALTAANRDPASGASGARFTLTLPLDGGIGGAAQ